jgi:hypothetical protein
MRGFEMPSLVGRFTHGERIRTLLEGTAASARQAEGSLRAAGYGAAADSIAGALRQVEQTVPKQKWIRNNGRNLDSAIDSIVWTLRTDLTAGTRELLQRDAAAHTDDSLRQLAAMLSVDPAGETTMLANPSRGIAELTGSITGPDDIDGARRVHAELARRAAGDAATLAEAHALFARDPAELSREQWRRLGELLRSDPDGTLLSGPRRIDHWKTLDDLAADGTNPQLHDTLRTYFAPWRLTTMPVAERVGVLRGILATAPEQVTPQQWRQLQLLMEHKPSLPAFMELLPGQDARSVVANSMGRLGVAPARRFHASWNVARMDEAARLEAARRILVRAPERLSEGEWAHLEALLRTDLPGPRHIHGINGFDTIAREQTHQVLARPSEPWDAAPYFSAWNEALDPNHMARVAGAVDALATGRATPDQLELLLIDRARLESLLEGRPPEQQLAIATAVLRGSADRPGASMEGTLRAISDGLAAPAVHEELEPLRLQTLELVERNLARLQGHTPEGAVRGYGRHPDYAEIGRVRANLDLIDSVTRRHAQEDAGELLRW